MLISISVIISIFNRLKNLGKVVGIVSSIVVPLVIFGNYNNYKLQKERLEIYKNDIKSFEKIYDERSKLNDSNSIKLEIDSLTKNEIDIFKKIRSYLISFMLSIQKFVFLEPKHYFYFV